MILRIVRAQNMRGVFRPPSDKSLTHRAYMLGAIASGESVVRQPLTGEDCESTLRCLAQMGLEFERSGTEVKLRPREWFSPMNALDCGNSGTTMRLLAGLIASRPIEATMVGDASLSKRPMRRIAEPLRLMGASVEGDTPPLHIKGRDLGAITYESPVASGQIKSAVLLAGLRAHGRTAVIEPHLSRDHTERMLSALGVPVSQQTSGDNSVSAIEGPAQPVGFDFLVPGDISGAAFFMVAATLLADSELDIQELGINPSRTGILDVLTMAGVDPRVLRDWTELGEPVADLRIQGCRELKPFAISGGLVPRLIDEIPVLAVLATQCEGTTVIRGAKELRVKESDRIELTAAGLRSMGAKVETFEDGMAITGPTPLHASRIEANHDHRIAMAFAVAGLIADGTTEIEGAEVIATSFPTFGEELRRLTA